MFLCLSLNSKSAAIPSQEYAVYNKHMNTLQQDLVEHSTISQMLREFREDCCYIAELHTGIARGRDEQSTYINKLISLGYKDDLEELLRYVAHKHLQKPRDAL